MKPETPYYIYLFLLLMLVAVSYRLGRCNGELDGVRNFKKEAYNKGHMTYHCKEENGVKGKYYSCQYKWKSREGG